MAKKQKISSLAGSSAPSSSGVSQEVVEWGCRLVVKPVSAEVLEQIRPLDDESAKHAILAASLFTIEGDKVFADPEAVAKRNPEVVARLTQQALIVNAIEIGAENGTNTEKNLD